jgi:hypothetical protein
VSDSKLAEFRDRLRRVGVLFGKAVELEDDPLPQAESAYPDDTDPYAMGMDPYGMDMDMDPYSMGVDPMDMDVGDAGDLY